MDRYNAWTEDLSAEVLAPGMTVLEPFGPDNENPTATITAVGPVGKTKTWIHFGAFYGGRRVGNKRTFSVLFWEREKE